MKWLFLFLSVAMLPVFSETCATEATPDSGPYPPEIARWDESEKAAQRAAGRQVLEDIRAAAAHGETRVSVPRGDYRFNEPVFPRDKASARQKAHMIEATHILLEDMHDLTIDFQGSTLWFETGQSGIVINHCRNVAVKNVILDWDPLPFVQGMVTAIDAGSQSFQVRLDPAFTHVVPEMRPGEEGEYRWRGAVFDAEGRFKAGQVGFIAEFSWDRLTPAGDYVVGFRGFRGVKVADSGLEPGDPIALWARLHRAVRTNDSEDCTWENLTLYCSPFIGFSENGGSRTVYRSCRIEPRPRTGRLIGGNADGINVTNMRQGPTIEGCVMRNIGDDFINVHNHYSQVLRQNGPDALICSRLNYLEDAARPPMTLDFYDRRTHKFLGTRQVVAISYEMLTLKPGDAFGEDLQWVSGASNGRVLRPGNTVPVHRVKLDHPITLEHETYVNNRDYASAGARILNNDFRGTLANGIRLMAPDAHIENNTLEWLDGTGILVMGQPEFWGEGSEAYNVVIKGNRLSHVGFGAREGEPPGAIVLNHPGPDPVQHDITIEGNIISYSNGKALYAVQVKNLVLRGNTIDHYGVGWSTPVLPGEKMAQGYYGFELHQITGLTLENNRFSAPAPQAQGEVWLENAQNR